MTLPTIAPPTAAPLAPTVVHELPGRLRLRLPPGTPVSPTAARLRRLPGVRAARPNRSARSVIVEYDGRSPTRTSILQNSGPAAPASSQPETAEVDETSLDPAPLTGLVTAGLAVVASLLLPRPVGRVITAVNIAPTLLVGIDTLVQRGVKVPVLDALSIGVTAARGEYVTANSARFLLSLAGYLEDSSAQRSDDLLQALLRPNPETAMVERDGVVARQPFAALSVGDRVHVSAGELIPVDGTVISGGATVNQSSVTGESLPIPKEPKALVLSGTVLEEGRLVISADRVGSDTTTARITQFIRETANRRGPTQRLAEELADRRVWISFAAGAAVLILTKDLKRLASVVLVDYSCSLKLGAAVAVKAALYRGARAGILIKGGEALEGLAKIDTVVFDKTGTLTFGDLMITEIVCFQPDAWPRDRLLAMIASVAEHSTHPVSAAVVDLAHTEGMAHIGHEEVDFFIGHGLTTRIAEGTLHIGSRHYLEDHEQVSFAHHDAALERLESEGNTLLHISLDRVPLGVIALRDRARPEAASVLRRLRKLGIRRLIMVTGDRAETAQRIANGLGLDAVIANAAPEDKADVLAGLKQDGSRIAFIGDGVNDGPALVSADVGIAMPMAADIARATADVILLENRLGGLADAVGLARTTLDLIERNFAVSVWTNTAIMGGASAGWLSPLVSSALHNGTTIALLAHALNAPRLPAAPAAGDP